MTVHGKKRVFRLVAKQTFLFVLLSFLALTAFTQQITLSFKNASLETVLREIERKTDYRFVYTKEELKLAKPVSFEITSSKIEIILNRLFNEQPLSYSINKNYVVIHKDENKIVSNLSMGIVINGNIEDEKGQPVVGASVLVKQSTIITVSDNNGKFTLTDIDDKSILVISSVGFVTKEIPLNGRKEVAIVLEFAINTLDETIVIAYGTTTNRLTTGNISKVSAVEIEKQPVSNPLAALQGRVPGLIITQTSGVAGSAFNIQLRGRTSLDLSLTRNDPLIIIDGVPFESGNLPSNLLGAAFNNPYASTNSSSGGLSPINSINPQDIESISVLKDADATAIYGNRGANGVILITTKKAKSGKTKFSIGVNSGFSRANRTMEFLNTFQYLQMRKEAFANDSVTPTNVNAPDLLLWDTTHYTNFKDLLIGNTAQATHVQASASGGNSNTQFLLGLGYDLRGNVFPGNYKDEKASVQLNLFHTPYNKKWDTRLSVIYASGRNSLPYTDLSKYLSLPPHLKLHTSDGRLAWQQGGVNYSSLGFSNPLAELNRKYSFISKNLSANLLINYHFSGSLIARISAGYNTFTTDEMSLTPKSAIAPENNTLASSQFANAIRNNWIAEPQLEYASSIGKGKLKILAGATIQQRNYRSTSINATNYTNDLLLNSINAAGSVSASNNSELYRYQAIFGRINYNLRQKYLLNLSLRRDGSSRFGPGRQFANFGAIGAGWIFSSESFAQKTLPFLSFGKLRSSFGITGNDQIGDYKYLDLWSSTFNPYQGTPGLRPTILFNPDYRWEKNKKSEAAIDLGFFKDKLSFSAAYYLHRSSNQLINYRLPNQTGFATVVKNLPALVQNTGIEITLDASIFSKRNFNWKSSFNITLPSNKLISFPGLSTSSYNSVYVEGRSLSVQSRLKFLGVDPDTGLYTYEDYNRDGVISTPGDLQVLGDIDPDLYGGFSNTFQYRDWQFDLFFQFTKQTGSNYLAYQYAFPTGFIYNQPVLVLDRWQKPGDEAIVQRYGAIPASPVFLASYNLSASNAIYSNASFIRLKNLSLTYNIPKNLLTKWKMESAKVYLQGQNLLTITNYIGADPETQSFYQLPPLKTIVFGIQFTF